MAHHLSAGLLAAAATILITSAGPALAQRATSTDANLPTCSVSVTDHCMQREAGQPTAHHKATRHHKAAKHHSKAAKKPAASPAGAGTSPAPTTPK